MPIPLAVLVVPAIGAFAGTVAPSVVQAVLEHFRTPLEKWGLEFAFKNMGFTIDSSNGFSREAITQAINAGPLAGTGVVLTNLFDRDAVRADLKRIALERAVQETGLTVKTLDVEGVKRALKEYIQSRVDQQLAAGGGDLIDAAKPLALLARDIQAANAPTNTPPGGNPGREQPVDFSEKGVKNRERQARYRANHTRHWELRA